MARWIIVGTMLAVAGGAPLCVAAQDRAVPPLLSPSPNAECQRQTLGLPPPAPGETTGSANLSDQLSRSKGVICPPAGIDPGLPCRRWEEASHRRSRRREHQAAIRA
jgi:hypothetical protein